MDLLSRLFKKSDKGTGTVRWYLLSTPWFGIKIHLNDCEEQDEHTHPWNGFAIILGSYEEDRDGCGWEQRRWFNRIMAKVKHRIRTSKPTYSIFVHGRRVNEDWYWGKENAPWRGPDVENT